MLEFRHRAQGDKAWVLERFRPQIPLLGIAILVPPVYTAFYPDPGYPLKWAPWLIVGWVILGIVYLFWRESRNEHIDIDYAFREAGADSERESV